MNHQTSHHFLKQDSNFVPSYTVDEIVQFGSDIEAYLTVATWTQNYLSRPHQDLGRSGPVCPFAPMALERQTMRISVIHFRSSDHRSEVENAVLQARSQFLASRTGSREIDVLRASLLAFPDVSLNDAPSVIDGTKEKLKAQFVADGLMLGEFHLLNSTGGLHNGDFHPLRCPVPLLAIRSIVSTDIVFLDRPEYLPEVRVDFLNAYLSADTQLSRVDRTRAEAALADALNELHTSRVRSDASGR